LIEVELGYQMETRSQRRRFASFSINAAIHYPLNRSDAGILILIMPRLLNYIVAIYLIIIGLIGVFNL
jgi:hypothetical protein